VKVGVLSDTPLWGEGLLAVEAILDQLDVEYDFQSLAEDRRAKITAVQSRSFVGQVRTWMRDYDKVLVIGKASATIALYQGANEDSKAALKSISALAPTSKVRGRMFNGYAGDDALNWPVPTVITIDPCQKSIRNMQAIQKDPELFRDLAFDICKLVEQDVPQPLPTERNLEYAICETPADVSEWLEALNSASVVSLDIETSGFLAQENIILCIGLVAGTSDGNAFGIVIPAIDLTDDNEVIDHPAWHGSLETIRDWLDAYHGIIPLHNLKFDLQHLWYRLGDFEIENPADTMLMHYALDERPAAKSGVHGLKLLSRLYFDAPDYDVDMKVWLGEFFREDDPEGLKAWELADRERWPKKWAMIDSGKKPLVVPALYRGRPSVDRRREMLEDLFGYQFLDCYYTLLLYHRLKAEMIAEDAERPHGNLQGLVDDHLTPLAMALAQIEHAGVPLDHKHFNAMRAKLSAELEQEVKDIHEAVTKLGFEVNPHSDEQLAELLYDKCGLSPVVDWQTQARVKSTDKDALKALAKQAEKKPALKQLIYDILAFRNTQKILSTYVDGIQNACDSSGVLHPDFFIHGTITGRLSCQHPNLQNVPATMSGVDDIKRGFRAPRGYKLINADYSQLELRIGTLISCDPILIEAFRNDEDIHAAVGQQLWGRAELSKRERMMAKMLNFGIFFGRGARSIAAGREMEYMLEETGEKWSEKEVQTFYDRYKARFAGLFGWIDEQHINAQDDQEVSNPFGRVRRFPYITKSNLHRVKRQSVNAPVQSSASDLTAAALVRIHGRLDPTQARILLTVHDSILVMSRTCYVEEACAIIREEMETNLPDLPTWFAPQGWCIPMRADIEVGQTWADCK
jgi:DNA polymerase I-like protein with 3'-5' exonuclease and polymerase domains